MMPLTTEQVNYLVDLVTTTDSDELSCGDCYAQIGEFAEASLVGRELTEGMKLVQRHLEQCPCCKDEYEALLVSLKALRG